MPADLRNDSRGNIDLQHRPLERALPELERRPLVARAATDTLRPDHRKLRTFLDTAPSADPQGVHALPDLARRSGSQPGCRDPTIESGAHLGSHRRSIHRVRQALVWSLQALAAASQRPHFQRQDRHDAHHPGPRSRGFPTIADHIAGKAFARFPHGAGKAHCAMPRWWQFRSLPPMAVSLSTPAPVPRCHCYTFDFPPTRKWRTG